MASLHSGRFPAPTVAAPFLALPAVAGTRPLVQVARAATPQRDLVVEPAGELETPPVLLPSRAPVPESGPEQAAPSQDLSSIIAMFDSHVTRTHDSTVGPETWPPQQPEAPRLYRPTLADSRRLGFGVGSRPAQDTEQVPSGTEPWSEAEAAVEERVEERAEESVEVSVAEGDPLQPRIVPAVPPQELAPRPPTAQQPTAQQSTAQQSTAQQSTAPQSTAQQSTAQQPIAELQTAREPTAPPSPPEQPTLQPTLDRRGLEQSTPGQASPNQGASPPTGTETSPARTVPDPMAPMPYASTRPPATQAAGAEIEPAAVSEQQSSRADVRASRPPAPPVTVRARLPRELDVPAFIDPQSTVEGRPVPQEESSFPVGPARADAAPVEPVPAKTAPVETGPLEKASVEIQREAMGEHRAAAAVGVDRDVVELPLDEPVPIPRSTERSGGDASPATPSRQPGAAPTRSADREVPLVERAGPQDEWPDEPLPPAALRSAPHEPAPAQFLAAHPPTIASFARLTGVDLGFVPVLRERESATAARRREARAFTQDGVIHLPAELGPMSSLDAEPVLAHELTHVMQQRALGDLAEETGPYGESLEAQARAVARTVSGDTVDPAEYSWAEEVDSSAGGMSWSPGEGFVRGLAHQVHGDDFSAAQRAPLVDALASRVPATQVPDLAAAPAETTVLEPRSETGTEPGILREEALPLLYPHDPEPVSSDVEVTAVAPAELAETQIDQIAQRLLGRLMVPLPPPLDPRSPDLLDALAGGLYGRLRSRLRSELLADREREGVLTEFH